uniref:Uncharacterized protein n=1 Tax=Anguilla anguilla TaxID=7936 RepID=A0A0E9X0C6_ANGAN
MYTYLFYCSLILNVIVVYFCGKPYIIMTPRFISKSSVQEIYFPINIWYKAFKLNHVFVTL